MRVSHLALVEVLRSAQRVGTLGEVSVHDTIEHSRHFARALPSGVRTVIDLGSGAGVPGLVIALERPELALTMVDRRAARMDALTLAVVGLGLADRVRVVTADAGHLGRMKDYAGCFDAVVCRGFGAPNYTARMARPFLGDGGLLVVSEPPNSDLSRWATDAVSKAGFGSAELQGAVAVLRAAPQKSRK